jgi:hypothetical protein
MYNGILASSVVSRGARRLGIERIPPIVTRGVLVDAASGGARTIASPVRVAELRSLLDAASVELRAGDALLLRTGWPAAARAGRQTGRHEAGYTPIAVPGWRASTLSWWVRITLAWRSTPPMIRSAWCRCT